MRQKCLILLKCSIMFLRQQRRTKTWISPRSTLKWFERAIDQGRKSCWNYKYKKVFPPSSLWVAVLINEGTNISGNMEKAGNVVVFPFKGDSLGLRHQTFPSLTSLLHKRHLEYLQIVCWKHCLWIGVQTTHMAWRDMNLWTRTWFKYGKPEMLLCSLSLGRRHQTFPSLTSLLHKRHLEYLQIVCWKHCLWIGVQTTYMVWRDMNMCTRTWFEIHKYVSVNIDHHMCVSKEGKY